MLDKNRVIRELSEKQTLSSILTEEKLASQRLMVPCRVSERLIY